ncbi:hypothetical protein Tco_0183185, partial [Tanacetum coccineum]
DLSVESVGSSFSRVILIGSNSVEVPVALEVGAAAVASPARRSRVASQSSSPTTFTPEILTAPIPPAPFTVAAPSTDIISPVDAPPGIHQRRAILF